MSGYIKCFENANFLGDKIPKENVHCVCIAIDSVMRTIKIELSTSLFTRIQIQNKENKDV